MASAAPLRLICHRRGALGLRLGLGPGLWPVSALQQLQSLLNSNSFWAQHRSPEDLSRALGSSAAVVSAWQGRQLVGFGRASSDGVYRAVLWDLVVAAHCQGQGLGRELVNALLQHRQLRAVERVYLMTSNSAGFYSRLGFTAVETQTLMLRSLPDRPRRSTRG